METNFSPELSRDKLSPADTWISLLIPQTENPITLYSYFWLWNYMLINEYCFQLLHLYDLWTTTEKESRFSIAAMESSQQSSVWRLKILKKIYFSRNNLKLYA